MSDKTNIFGKSFYWGAATAAFQVEGGLDDKTDYGIIAKVDGGIFKEPAGQACDHYHHFPEDIQMLSELGFGAYRFTLEWARVEPQEGHFDVAAIEHYRRVIQTCRRYGVTPVITLHHFTSPRWLIAGAGWEDDRTPQLFARYVAHIMDYLGAEIVGRADKGSECGVICTFNEVNDGALNNVTLEALKQHRQQPWVRRAARELGTIPEQFTPWKFAASEQALKVILASHRAAIQQIKQRFPELPVGLTVASQNILTFDQHDEEAVVYAKQRWNWVENRFLRALGNEPSGDFIGVQAYTRRLIGRTSEGVLGAFIVPERTRLTQMGYEFHPESLGVCLDHTYKLTKLPMIVTECGIGTEDDIERIEYYNQILESVADRIRVGMPIKGWFAWSLLDNYEWEYGYEKRFGIIHVDYTTQQRTLKPSARWFVGQREKFMNDSFITTPG